jgi:uncharacterized membrane protein YphA (DoxX/SURF4 family)
MKILGAIGRIIYSVPFVIFGVFHFMNASSMASTMLSGWPYGEILLYISGAAFILGGVAILFGFFGRLAGILLAVLLLIIILAIHLPGVQAGNQMSVSSLLKDSALLGAALSYAATMKK